MGGATGGSQPSRRRGSTEKMVDRAKAHGVNVAISFGSIQITSATTIVAYGMAVFIEPKPAGVKHAIGLNNR